MKIDRKRYEELYKVLTDQELELFEVDTGTRTIEVPEIYYSTANNNNIFRLEDVGGSQFILDEGDGDYIVPIRITGLDMAKKFCKALLGGW